MISVDARAIGVIEESPILGNGLGARCSTIMLCHELEIQYPSCFFLVL